MSSDPAPNLPSIAQIGSSDLDFTGGQESRAYLSELRGAIDQHVHTWRRYPHPQRMRQCPACGMLQVYRGKQWHVSLHSPTQAERGATSMTTNDQPADMAAETIEKVHLILNQRKLKRGDMWYLGRDVMNKHVAILLDELERTRERIAALEAREAKMEAVLREAVEYLEHSYGCSFNWGEACNCWVSKARALLSEVVARGGNEVGK